MQVRRFPNALTWLAIVLSAASTSAAEFHVTPTGSPKGNGSQSAPWDLATALAAEDRVQPGDTVWIHAGTYRGGFVSRLRGRPDAPVVVRGRPGERVTIDTNPRDERDTGALQLLGADAVYRDFEVTCSHRHRETTIAGPWPADIRRGSIDIRGDRIAAVNLVVHDCASGFGFWAEGEGGLISGCLIYNNGWRGPDRGHGHAIYAQNARGTKQIKDNIIFHQFAYGIHVYGSEKASLKGFEIDGNIAFDNGCLTRPDDHSPGILVGGGSPAARIAVRDNVVVGGGVRLGYPWGVPSDDFVFTGNYCEGLVVRDFRQGTVAKNTIVAHSNVVQLEAAARPLVAGLRWDDNDYYVTDGRWGECAMVEGSKSRGLAFSEWRSATGFDAASRFMKGAPDKLRVVVSPNAHESGRANVAILNPQGLAAVDVDLSGVLKVGTKFRIASAKDFFGQPLVAGVYDGQSVCVPLTPITPPPPVGMPDAKTPLTEPQFAALVVLSE